MTYTIIISTKHNPELVFKHIKSFYAEPGRIKLFRASWVTVENVTGFTLRGESDMASVPQQTAEEIDYGDYCTCGTVRKCPIHDMSRDELIYEYCERSECVIQLEAEIELRNCGDATTLLLHQLIESGWSPPDEAEGLF